MLPRKGEWRIVLEFLRDTDPVLLQRISRKLINHLSWNGVTEAKELLQRDGVATAIGAAVSGGENRPMRREPSPSICGPDRRKPSVSPASTSARTRFWTA